MSCVIVSRPGIEPMLSVLEAQSLSHGMTRKVLFFSYKADNLTKADPKGIKMKEKMGRKLK